MVKILLAILFLVIYLPLTLVIGGFTIMTLWNWFIVGLFENVTSLTLVPAVGLGLVVGYMTHQTPEVGGEKSIEQNLMELVAPFLRSGMVLLVGYILKFHFS